MTAVNDTPGEPMMYTLKAAAPMLGMSEPQLRRLARARKIRSRNTGKMYLFSAEAIREYAAGADEPMASAS